MIHKEETKTTITFLDSYGDEMYLTHLGQRHSGEWVTTASEENWKACDISHLSPDQQVAIMFQLEDEYEGKDFRIVTISTTTTEMDFKNDEYREAIQKNAIAKLSQYEVEALGLGKIALYIKTKYHGAEMDPEL